MKIVTIKDTIGWDADQNIGRTIHSAYRNMAVIRVYIINRLWVT